MRLDNYQTETITLAAAASQFSEASVETIQRWISLGFIQACSVGSKTRILRSPFEAQVRAMQDWLQDFYTDEQGIIWASTDSMEQFWLSLPENESKCTNEFCDQFGKPMTLTWERWKHKEYVCADCGCSAITYASQL